MFITQNLHNIILPFKDTFIGESHLIQARLITPIDLKRIIAFDGNRPNCAESQFEVIPGVDKNEVAAG
jgi:hypothetical protein